MTVLEYFGLNEQPFRLGPDPRYLFYSGQVKEAIAKCEYMARDRVGPIYMYGPIGSGKTSILRRIVVVTLFVAIRTFSMAGDARRISDAKDILVTVVALTKC
jgi:type II secretory pathway predicted ATPase ExeA